MFIIPIINPVTVAAAVVIWKVWRNSKYPATSSNTSSYSQKTESAADTEEEKDTDVPEVSEEITFMSVVEDVFSQIEDENDKEIVEDYLNIMKVINPFLWEALTEQLEEKGCIDKEIGQALEECLKVTLPFNKKLRARIQAFDNVMQKYLPTGASRVDMNMLLFGNAEVEKEVPEIIDVSSEESDTNI